MQLDRHDESAARGNDQPGHPRGYQRARSALWRVTSGGLVILPPIGEPIALTGAAVTLWELLADRRDVADVTQTLAARFDVSEQEVADMVTPVLRQLVGTGAVEER